MKEVKTTDELLAMRDSSGVINHEGDLKILCDVPWLVGKHIIGIKVTGNLYCRGNLDCGGYLYCRGNLDCGGNLYCGGYLDCRGEYFVCQDLYWGQAHKPVLPEKNYIKRVLPPEHQRDHWQERLGMDLSEGCYEHLCKIVFKQVLNLLKDEKWSSTERWMLETLRDSKKPEPEWVEEVRNQEQAA